MGFDSCLMALPRPNIASKDANPKANEEKMVAAYVYCKYRFDHPELQSHEELLDLIATDWKAIRIYFPTPPDPEIIDFYTKYLEAHPTSKYDLFPDDSVLATWCSDGWEIHRDMVENSYPVFPSCTGRAPGPFEDDSVPRVMRIDAIKYRLLPKLESWDTKHTLEPVRIAYTYACPDDDDAATADNSIVVARTPIDGVMAQFPEDRTIREIFMGDGPYNDDDETLYAARVPASALARWARQRLLFALARGLATPNTILIYWGGN